MKMLINGSAAVASAGLSVLCVSNIKRIRKLRKAGILTRTEAVTSYAIMGAGSVMYAAGTVVCVKDMLTPDE